MRRKNSWSIFSFFNILFDSRYLVFQLTKREIMGRYKGSALGILWSLIVPLFMLAIYTYVFSIIFQAKWHPSNSSATPDLSTDKFYFALVLFAGLIIFNIFSEITLKSSNLIVSNPNFVKKILFPIELLPLPAIGAASFHLVISLLVLLVFSFITGHQVPMTFLLIPLIILPLLFFCLGLCWIFSAIGVYFRDIQQIVGLTVSVLMFVTPVFYSLSAVPGRFHEIVELNPLTHFIEWARQVLILGETPTLISYSLGFIGCFLFAWIGFIVFQMSKDGFADVI